MTIPFRPIARLLARTLRPQPDVDLSALEPHLSRWFQAGVRPGILVAANHYHAHDYQIWWTGILITAILPFEISWLTTSGWTNSGWLDRFTHWLFPLGASLLGFTAMPAMPPNPAETEQRASAVRQVLRYARQTPQPVIAITPEGRDIPGGILGELPPGVGRFIYLLSQHCPLILPTGVWKDHGRINVKFGSPYPLDVPAHLSPVERDLLVGQTIMNSIAVLLPEHLRGNYTT